MPLNCSDIKTLTYQKLDSFIRFTLRNPIAASLTLSLIFTLIIIWIFRNDNEISQRTLKIIKVFIYSLITAVFIFFMQNSLLIREKNKPISSVIGGDIIQGGGLRLAEQRNNDSDYTQAAKPIYHDSMYDL